MRMWGLFCLFAFVFVVPEFGAAEVNWRGSGGWGAGLPYHRLYDNSARQNAKGKILQVTEFTPIRGMSDGISLWLQTREESLLVHLGPAWFLERQDFSLQRQIPVTVKGSRITFEGETVLIASEVRQEDKILILRDEEGFPLWSAWRRR